MSSQATQGHGSQHDQDNEARAYRLVDGTMEVVSAGKKNPEAPFMTLDLLFRLEDRPGQVVGECLFRGEVRSFILTCILLQKSFTVKMDSKRHGTTAAMPLVIIRCVIKILTYL